MLKEYYDEQYAYGIDELNFEIIEIDNENGKCKYCVDDEEFCKIYGNNVYELGDFLPYYIKPKSIDVFFTNQLPSEITELDFIKNFVEMSEEFLNRNLSELEVNLIADDEKGTLQAEIT